MFLKGETSHLKKQIKKKMKNASKEQNYEIAAFWRDKLQAIENSTTEQHVLLNEELDKDIIGFYSKDQIVSMVIIHIREGKITNKSPFSLNLRQKLIQQKDILNSILEQYYQDTLHNLPDIIIVPKFYGDFELLKEILKDNKKTIKIRKPIEKNEKALMRIANKNAKVMVLQKIEMEELKEQEKDEFKSILQDIKELFDLPEVPRIIEGFDISNIEGKNATGSMVYFLEGKPYKKYYRHYKIRSKTTPDDPGMMKEVIRRRYSKLLENDWTLPNLILIDGGKGQLNAAVSVLKDLGLSIPVISLAKRLEEIFIPDKKDSIILPDDSSVLKLFQQVRDEAHRFAVRLHKKQRQKKFVGSILDDIKGIGPATRNKLLKKFGSVEGVRNASREELTKIVNQKLAEKIIQKFEKKS